MLGEASEVLVNVLRMRWKVASLEVMGRRVLPAPLVPVGCFVSGRWEECSVVEEMKVLGDMVNNDGGTTTAGVSSRNQGNVTYYKHDKLFRDRHQALELRLSAWAATPRTSCMHGASTWGVCVTQL